MTFPPSWTCGCPKDLSYQWSRIFFVVQLVKRENCPLNTTASKKNVVVLIHRVDNSTPKLTKTGSIPSKTRGYQRTFCFSLVLGSIQKEMNARTRFIGTGLVLLISLRDRSMKKPWCDSLEAGLGTARIPQPWKIAFAHSCLQLTDVLARVFSCHLSSDSI